MNPKNFPSVSPDAFELPVGWEPAITRDLLADIFARSVAATQTRGITALTRREADQLAANALVAAYAFARLQQAISK